MSNEIYGYIESDLSTDLGQLFVKLERDTGLGFSKLNWNELYNIPHKLIPADKSTAVPFIMGDGPGKRNATYLLSETDYAPDAVLELPLKSEERLEVLVHALRHAAVISHARRLVVALTDSSQVAKTKVIRLTEMESQMKEDCRREMPPDCVYVIECQ